MITTRWIRTKNRNLGQRKCSALSASLFFSPGIIFTIIMPIQRWWLWKCLPGSHTSSPSPCRASWQRQMTLKPDTLWDFVCKEKPTQIIWWRICFRCGHAYEIWGQRLPQHRSCLQRRMEHMVVKLLPPDPPPSLGAHLKAAGGAVWD